MTDPDRPHAQLSWRGGGVAAMTVAALMPTTVGPVAAGVKHWHSIICHDLNHAEQAGSVLLFTHAISLVIYFQLLSVREFNHFHRDFYSATGQARQNTALVKYQMFSTSLW